MKINFRIFLTILLFFFWFTSLTFATQNAWCTGFNCKSEITQPKGEWSLEGIEEIVISSDENLKSEWKLKVYNNFNFERLDTKWIIYNYVNPKWEGIVFYDDWMSCNLNTKICIKTFYPYLWSSIFTTNDYIVFVSPGSNVNINIYSKKLHRFLTISNYIHYNIEWTNITFKYREFLSFSNFEVKDYKLMFLYSFWINNYSNLKNVWEIRFTIDFSKLKDEDFNNNKIYFFYSNSENNKFDTDTSNELNYYWERLTPLSIKSLDDDNLYMRLPGTREKFKDESLSWVSLKFTLVQDLNYDIQETLKNLLTIYNKKIYYIWKWFVFHKTSFNRVWSNQIAISYDNDWVLQTRYLELWWNSFIRIFTSFNILWLYYNPNDKKNYVSFLEDRAFSSPKFLTLRFPEKDFVKLQNVEFFENSFYLWNLWKIHLYTDNSILNLWFEKNLDFPPFFVSKNWDDLHFYYIWSWWKNLFKTINPVVSWRDNPWLTFDFSSNSFSPTWEVYEKDKDWKVIDQDYVEKEKERLEKLKESKEEQEKKLEEWKQEFSEKFWFLETVWLLVKVLNFEINVNSYKTFNIPILKPVIENWKLKVDYEKVNTNLKPIDDNLNIAKNTINSDNQIWKDFLTVIFVVLYVFFRILVIWLIFIFSIFVYKIINTIVDYILPWISNDWTSWNVFSFLAYMSFLIVFSVLVYSLFSLSDNFLLFFNNIINFLDSIFVFFLESFFNLYLFLKILQTFNLWLYWCIVLFVIYKLALKFWRIL